MSEFSEKYAGYKDLIIDYVDGYRILLNGKVLPHAPNFDYSSDQYKSSKVEETYARYVFLLGTRYELTNEWCRENEVRRMIPAYKLIGPDPRFMKRLFSKPENAVHEYKEFILCALDGKEVQYFCDSSQKWHTITSLHVFSWPNLKLRIKPESQGTDYYQVMFRSGNKCYVSSGLYTHEGAKQYFGENFIRLIEETKVTQFNPEIEVTQ
jgi:hypothetical protein